MEGNMPIMGDANVDVKALAEALVNILGKCCVPSDDDDEETIEEAGDVLTYRKTTTVVEVNVSMAALTSSGIELIQALSEAFRSRRDKVKDPLDQVMETLERLRRSGVMPGSPEETIETNESIKEHIERYRAASEKSALEKTKTEALNAVFGSAHVGASGVTMAVLSVVQRLARSDKDSGTTTLDRDGLADIAAQLVAMIPEDRWSAMVARESMQQAEPAVLGRLEDASLTAAFGALVGHFVPAQHGAQVLSALLDAAKGRKKGAEPQAEKA